MQADELSSRLSDFEERNTALIGIGNGTVQQAINFKNEIKFKGDLYTDPSKQTYNALNLKHGFFSMLTWSGVKASREASQKGYSVNMGLLGDPLQLGGLIIVDKEKGLMFHHIAQTTHDHPNIDKLLEICSQ